VLVVFLRGVEDGLDLGDSECLGGALRAYWSFDQLGEVPVDLATALCRRSG
jgi:hypothetical protein